MWVNLYLTPTRTQISYTEARLEFKNGSYGSTQIFLKPKFNKPIPKNTGRTGFVGSIQKKTTNEANNKDLEGIGNEIRNTNEADNKDFEGIGNEIRTRSVGGLTDESPYDGIDYSSDRRV